MDVLRSCCESCFRSCVVGMDSLRSCFEGFTGWQVYGDFLVNFCSYLIFWICCELCNLCCFIFYFRVFLVWLIAFIESFRTFFPSSSLISFNDGRLLSLQEKHNIFKANDSFMPISSNLLNWSFPVNVRFVCFLCKIFYLSQLSYS